MPTREEDLQRLADLERLQRLTRLQALRDKAKTDSPSTYSKMGEFAARTAPMFTPETGKIAAAAVSPDPETREEGKNIVFSTLRGFREIAKAAGNFSPFDIGMALANPQKRQDLLRAGTATLAGSGLVGGVAGIMERAAGRGAAKVVKTVSEAIPSREPWQMTREEFGKEFFVRGTSKLPSGAASEVSGGLAAPAHQVLGDEWHRSEPFRYSMGKDGEVHLFRTSSMDNPGSDIHNPYLLSDALPKKGETPELSIPRADLAKTDPHRFLVERALSEGKPVPQSVLNDYPNILRVDESTALKQTEIESIREGLGLESISPAQTHTFRAAHAAGADVDALGIADEILNAKRPTTDVEHAGMVIKARQLIDQANAAKAKQAELLSAGNEGAAALEGARFQTFQDQLERLTRAEKYAGTEAGRAMSIRRMRVNSETYDLASTVQRATQIKGGRLTPEELAGIESAVGKYAKQTDPVAQQIARGEVDRVVERVRPHTAKSLGAEAINLMRTVKTTADMGVTLRQNLMLSPARPLAAAKAFGKGVQAFFSTYKAHEIDMALRGMDSHAARESAGLYLAPLDDVKVGHREEFFQSNWAERIPVLGRVVKASNRQFVTATNVLRAHAFDEILKHVDATDAQRGVWADYINKASGRGNLGDFTAAANKLSTVFFAPRFAASRFQAPVALVKALGNPGTRRMAAKEVGALVGTGMMAMTLAKLSGAEVSADPKSPDFGKIKIGDTRIDVWGGFQQTARLALRMGIVGAEATGIKEKSRRNLESPTKIGLEFLRSKFSPPLTVAEELATRREFGGDPSGPLETVGRAFTPMIGEDIWDAYQDGGVSRAIPVGAASFLGAGASTYDRRSR